MTHLQSILLFKDSSGFGRATRGKGRMIIHGGSNIAPVEIERVLMAHPAVRDAAVVGVLDPELGEHVAGFVP